MADSDNGHLVFIYGNELPPVKDAVPYVLNDYEKGIVYKKTGFFGKGGYAFCYEFQNTSTEVKYAFKVVSKYVSPTKKKALVRKTRRRDVHIVQEEPDNKAIITNKVKENVFLDHGNNMVFNEAALHEPLRHENVVRLHGFFEDDMNVYLVLEPCIYGSLGQVLDNRKRLSLMETRYYVRQIALGCQYLREQLVVHHDLKPNNVFIDENMKVKIGDFGLAVKMADTSAKSMLFCGTLNYMAPEVVCRKGHSFEVDVWAIGCIVYELLVGHSPFQTVSREATFELIASSLHHPIPEDVKLPRTVINFIEQTLRVNPRTRLTPSEIINSAFLREGPDIPKWLPVSLLKGLPEPRDECDSEQLVNDFVEAEIKKLAVKSLNRNNYFNYRYIFRLISRCFPCRFMN